MAKLLLQSELWLMNCVSLLGLRNLLVQEAFLDQLSADRLKLDLLLSESFCVGILLLSEGLPIRKLNFMNGSRCCRLHLLLSCLFG